MCYANLPQQVWIRNSTLYFFAETTQRTNYFLRARFKANCFFSLLKMSKVFYRAQTLKSFQPPAFKSSCLQLLSQSHRLHIKYGSMVFLS